MIKMITYAAQIIQHYYDNLANVRAILLQAFVLYIDL